MKYQIMMDMFFTLLARKQVSAGEFSKRYEISPRSVYRYVDELTVSGVPIDVKQGRGGGIYIPDSYKLPMNFMRKEEYIAAIDAMKAMRGQVENKNLDSAIDKLSRQVKEEIEDSSLIGDIMVDSSTWGDYRFTDKIKLLQSAIQSREVLEIDYVSRTGDKTKRKIEPHILIYKQNVWYVYAYCLKRKEFRLFKVGRIRSAQKTGGIFQKRSFSRNDIPLQFSKERGEMTEIKFLIDEEILPDAEEWLGMECILREEGSFTAVVTLPDDEGLIKKILSLGNGIEVVYPEHILTAVRESAERNAASSRK